MIKGFSKLNRNGKIETLSRELSLKESQKSLLTQFFDFDESTQQKFEGFSENVLSTYAFPFSVAPNFLINNDLVHVPMVIEESSVVAAASYAAGFWAKHGGFHCEVLGTTKIGQIFFRLREDKMLLKSHLGEIKTRLKDSVKPISQNMVERGGGVLDISLKDFSEKVFDVYEFEITFKTSDSMGANYINSCLELMAAELIRFFNEDNCFEVGDFEVIMAILSNYTPECLVRCWVEAPVEALAAVDPAKNGENFAKKFVTAVQIARNDVYRATTHNKGIFNGISAVLLATANDFRAVEAAGHAYASKDKGYRSLSKAKIEDGIFELSLTIPLAVGTVGGLTKLHPMANLSFDIMKNPDAKKLMMIVAAAGLASNFAAVRSLITTGIQAGHMKMHLKNILQFLNANNEESEKVIAHFSDKIVSYSEVKLYLASLRD